MLRTTAIRGNGIADLTEILPGNTTTTAVDVLQEMVTATETEKATGRRATTVEVEAKAHGEIDHLTMEDRLAEK